MDKSTDRRMYSELQFYLMNQDPSGRKIMLMHSRILKLSIPENKSTYYRTAKILQNTQELQKRIFPIKMTIIRNPQNMAAYNHLAGSLIKLGKENECFSFLKKSLSNSPKEAALHRLILRVTEQLNRRENLLSFYQETADSMEDEKSIMYLYFYSAEALGEESLASQAREQYKKAFGTGAMEANHHVKYAELLIREEKYEEAIVQFEYACRLSPTDALAMDKIFYLSCDFATIEKTLKTLWHILDNGLGTEMMAYLILVLSHLGKYKKEFNVSQGIPEILQVEKLKIQELCKVLPKEIQEKLERDRGEETREFYTKKLEALNQILCLL